MVPVEDVELSDTNARVALPTTMSKVIVRVLPFLDRPHGLDLPEDKIAQFLPFADDMW